MILTDERIPKEIQMRLSDRRRVLCQYLSHAPMTHREERYLPQAVLGRRHRRHSVHGQRSFDPTADVIKTEDYDPDHQIGGLGRLIVQSFATPAGT